MTTAEILGAHLLTQLTVTLIQVAIVLLMSFVVFGLECIGSMVAVTIMVFLLAICGMCYGFLISVVCNSHAVANYLSSGSFYPVILLGGERLYITRRSLTLSKTNDCIKNCWFKAVICLVKVKPRFGKPLFASVYLEFVE